MATRQEVYSLFGIKSPQQVMAERNQEYAAQLSRLSGAGQAGFGIASGLRSLFGGESEQMTQAKQMQEALAGIDTTDPSAIRQAAQAVSAFAPEAAIQMGEYALNLEKEQRGAPVNFERQAVDENGQPIFRQTFNALGEPTGQTPVMVNVPHVRGADGNYIPIDPRYANLGTAQPTANANDSQVASQPDFIVDPQTKRLVPNPAKSGQAPAQTGQAPVAQQPFEVQRDPRITAETEQAMASATGPRGGGSMGSITAVPPPPKLEAETTYLNPQEAQIISDQLRDEITALDRSNDPNKAQKIAELKKKRSKIQKLRIASRRQDQEKNLRNRRGK